MPHASICGEEVAGDVQCGSWGSRFKESISSHARVCAKGYGLRRSFCSYHAVISKRSCNRSRYYLCDVSAGERGGHDHLSQGDSTVAKGSTNREYLVFPTERLWEDENAVPTIREHEAIADQQWLGASFEDGVVVRLGSGRGRGVRAAGIAIICNDDRAMRLRR